MAVQVFSLHVHLPGHFTATKDLISRKSIDDQVTPANKMCNQKHDSAPLPNISGKM